MKLITLQETIDKQILEWCNERARIRTPRLTNLTMKGFGQSLEYLEEINGEPLVLCTCNECGAKNVDVVQLGKYYTDYMYVCKKCVAAAANLF